MKTYTIAAIPGDGIGREVVAAGLQVLDQLAARDGGFRLDVRTFDWCSNYFDITGKGIANPIGTFWPASLMLEHLVEAKAAERLMRAIERVTAEKRWHSPDLGGTATTKAVTDAVCEAVRAENA